MAPRKDGTAREAGAISLSQASTNFGHSTARLRRIKKLQFGIINPEELKQYSVTQAITVNGRKIPAGVTRYEVCVCVCLYSYYNMYDWFKLWGVYCLVFVLLRPHGSLPLMKKRRGGGAYITNALDVES